jgi:glycine/serine hydroxymethyltransferase
MKYEIAYYNNIEMVNPNGLFLSRIYKKNGKHRYYITKEIVDTIEVDYSDRCIELFCYEYSSKYVGKNLKQAILQLLYDK